MNYSVNTVAKSVNNINTHGFRVDLCVNGVLHSCILDTGAEVTVLTENSALQIGGVLKDQSRILRGADGSPLEVLGERDVTISTKRGLKVPTTAYVVKGSTSNLLGRDEIQTLGLISVVNNVSSDQVISQYPKLFKG